MKLHLGAVEELFALVLSSLRVAPVFAMMRDRVEESLPDSNGSRITRDVPV